MAYYRGDYMRGYYRGDPLSLGGIFGGLAKFGLGLLPGGSVATKVIDTLHGLAGGMGGNKLVPTATPPLMPGNQPISTLGLAPIPGVAAPKGTPGAVPVPGLGGAIQRFLPGGKSGYEIAPAGYHIIKSGKHAGMAVKNRRMNVTNPRALRRSIRRVSGFGKVVSRMKRAVARANTAVGNKHSTRRAFRRR